MKDLSFIKRPYQHKGEEKFYFDYVISGKPLSDILHIGESYSGVLGYWSKENDRRHIALLTKRVKPELDTNRIQLYGCPACGDIGCGAITVQIEFIDNKVLWRNIAIEDLDGYEGYKMDESFEFEVKQYFQAFAALSLK